MKKQIATTVLGISLIPVSALNVHAAESFDMAFCDRYVMHNTPTYSSMCEDANLYDSHMAEFKARSFQALMRYVWKKGKSKDRRAGFTDSGYDPSVDSFLQYNANNLSVDKRALKRKIDDTKIHTKSIFDTASYRLRVNRHKFIMKIKFKF